MRRRIHTGIGAALFLVLVPVLSQLGAGDTKDLSIKQIMGRLNKGEGLHPTLAEELKADKPDWSEIQKQSKEFVELATALGTKEPRKGDKESWAKFTSTYATNAKALESAAEKKDLAAAKAAHAKLGAMCCSSCHKAHRPTR